MAGGPGSKRGAGSSGSGRVKRARADGRSSNGAATPSVEPPAQQTSNELLENLAAANASKAGAADDRQPNDGPATTPSGRVAGVPVARRTVAHNAARRRAAHFAHFQAEADEEEDTANALHTGGDNARDLGPFASARQLTQGRAAALQARSNKLLEDARAARDAKQGVSWTPSRQPGAERRAAQCAVKPLFGICLDLLVEYIDDVESLWGLPDGIKTRLAMAVAEQRKMSSGAARLWTEGAPSEVALPDCTQLEPPALAAALADCATPRLERLELRLCGRPFGDEAAAALAAAAPLSALTSLTLTGAYRLTDGALGRVLRALPALQELRLPQANCLTGEIVEQLPQLAPHLEVLDLEECRGVGVESLGYALTGLPSLRVLNLSGNLEVSDALLSEAALAAPFREVSLCRCPAVTDAGVAALAAGNPQLEVLRLDYCTKVSAVGIAAVAESCRRLRVLSLRECTKVTDEAVVAIAQNGSLEALDISGVPHVGAATIKALATCCKERLERLDVSFCRQFDDEQLGLLADSCPSLRSLALFGCSQATRTFLEGHSNDTLVMHGANDLTCAA